MAMKWFSAFPKAPAFLEPHHQIVKCHITLRLFFWGRGTYTSAEKQLVYSIAASSQVSLLLRLLTWHRVYFLFFSLSMRSATNHVIHSFFLSFSLSQVSLLLRQLTWHLVYFLFFSLSMWQAINHKFLSFFKNYNKNGRNLIFLSFFLSFISFFLFCFYFFFL